MIELGDIIPCHKITDNAKLTGMIATLNAGRPLPEPRAVQFGSDMVILIGGAHRLAALIAVYGKHVDAKDHVAVIDGDQLTASERVMCWVSIYRGDD